MSDDLEQRFEKLTAAVNTRLDGIEQRLVEIEEFSDALKKYLKDLQDVVRDYKLLEEEG